MANSIKIKVNGLTHGVSASLDTPLLYVLHNELHLHGPRFGCGLAQCGACSVLLDGKEIRSCVTPVAAVAGGASRRSRGSRPCGRRSAEPRRRRRPCIRSSRHGSMFRCRIAATARTA